MKIRVHFRDQELGTVEADGGRATASTPRLTDLVEYHRQATGLEGAALVKYLLHRLRGQTWAEEVAGVEAP